VATLSAPSCLAAPATNRFVSIRNLCGALGLAEFEGAQKRAIFAGNNDERIFPYSQLV